ncbi:MAG TPA: hypothetical protein VHO67_01500, partial [Polyangia bacterium]|nr:hypothetical protein [Polyangia bacterium]
RTALAAGSHAERLSVLVESRLASEPLDHAAGHALETALGLRYRPTPMSGDLRHLHLFDVAPGEQRSLFRAHGAQNVAKAADGLTGLDIDRGGPLVPGAFEPRDDAERAAPDLGAPNLVLGDAEANPSQEVAERAGVPELADSGKEPQEHLLAKVLLIRAASEALPQYSAHER